MNLNRKFCFGTSPLLRGILALSLMTVVSCGKDEPNKSVGASSASAKVDAPSASEIKKFMIAPEANTTIPASLSGLREGLKNPETIKNMGYELQATDLGDFTTGLVILHDRDGKRIQGLNLSGMGLKNGDDPLSNEVVDLINGAMSRYSKLDRSHWELVKIAYLRGRLSFSKGGHGNPRFESAKAAIDAEESFFKDFKDNYPGKNLSKMTQDEIKSVFEDYLDYFTPAQPSDSGYYKGLTPRT